MAKAIREWYCRDCRGEGDGMDMQADGASQEKEPNGRSGHGEKLYMSVGRVIVGLW